MGLLGDLTVRISTDLSNLKTQDATKSMNDVSQAAKSVTDALKSIGSPNMSGIVSGSDEARAKLVLIESEANKARQNLQELQEAAASGGGAEGIAEASAKLVLMEGKAQEARDALKGIEDEEKNVGKGGSFFSDLGEMGQSALSKIGSIGKSAFSGLYSGITNLIPNVINFASNLGFAVNNIKMLATSVVDFGQSLLAPAENAEQMTTAFTTLLGSAQAATDIMEKLDSFAAKTPFKTMDIQQAASQLIGFGTNAKDVIPDLTAIGDALSAVGKGSSANMMGIVDIFGKIQTQGGLTVGIMQQLSRDGINAWSILEKQTGKNKDELQDFISQGLYPANDAINDLTTGIEANPLYAGGMAKQSGTMIGLISTLKSNWDQMLASFGSPIIKGLEPVISKLGSTLASPQFKQFATVVGTDIVGALTKAGTLISTTIGPAFKQMGAVINDEPMGVFIASLKDLGGAALNVFTAFSPVLNLLKDTSDGMKGVSGPGSALAGILYQVSDVIQKDIVPILNNLAGFLNQVMPPAMDIVKQGMQGVKDILEKVKGPIGDLLAALGPIVAKFIEWIDKSGIVHNVLDTVGTVVGTVVEGTAKLVTGVKDVVKFFKENKVAADLLIIPLTVLASIFTVLAVVAIVALIAMLPEMIAGFVAGAAAAWSLAIAVIAATWPFLLIAAIIGAVIAIVVICIQNWGSITKWFQGVWSAFTVWFMVVLKAVGAWFVSVWNGMIAFFVNMGHSIAAIAVNIWNGILNGVRTAWAFIVGAVRAGINFVLNIVKTVFAAIGQAFVWLYNHNYYIKALVDFVVNAFKWCVNFAIQVWSGFIVLITAIWQNVVNIATSVFNNVVNAISTGFNTAIGFVKDVWKKISDVFSTAWQVYIVTPLTTLWKNVSQKATDAWNDLSSALSGLWSNISSSVASVWDTYVATPWNNFWDSVINAVGDKWSDMSNGLNSFFNNISNTISGWATDAYNWGVNMIQGFINGIGSMVSSVGDAVSKVANQVWQFLGFHSPTKAGKGAESDRWAPNFVKMFAGGLEAGSPQIAASVTQLVKPLVALGGGYPAPNVQGRALSAVAAAAPGIAAANQAIHVYVGMDTASVSESVSKYQQQKTRQLKVVRR